jgi:hypothetical protein
MSRSESKSGSDEEQIKNDYNSFEKTNETPNYFKEYIKSDEERNKNENKSNGDEIGEKSYPIKEDASSPNLSGIGNKYSQESQKQKENRDKSQEGEEGRRSNGSLFSSSNDFSNQLKSFFEEEEDESKDIIRKEIGKIIKKLIEIHMNWEKKNKDKKLNKKEDQINGCNSNIGKNFKLENRISEKKFIIDNLKESEEHKIKNDDLEKKNVNLGKKISEQNNKNNQLDIKIEQLVINNKDLEDRRQRGENSKGKNLILSPSQKELKNALKKKEEKEKKNRCKILKISSKYKVKEKIKSIEKNKNSESESVIIKREKLAKSKIFNKYKKKKIKNNNNLIERKEINYNNQKSEDINNIKNDLKHKDDEIKQLKNKIQILENENNELRNKIMILIEKPNEKIDMKDEIQRIYNKLSILATKSEMNIHELKLDEILNNQRNIMEKMQASNSQNQNISDINVHNSILSNQLNSQIILEEIQQ